MIFIRCLKKLIWKKTGSFDFIKLTLQKNINLKKSNNPAIFQNRLRQLFSVAPTDLFVRKRFSENR